MKLLFASDIHGCANATRQILDYFQQENFDYLILLGDVLNHGPRNPLPEGYDPMATVEMLNTLADSIIAVRGNCDGEVDQALLNFPITADYNSMLIDGRRWFFSHGHLYSPENMPPLKPGDVFGYGHKHLPELRQTEACWLFNPGSVTMPRGGNPASFGEYQNGCLSLRRLDTGEVFDSRQLADH